LALSLARLHGGDLTVQSRLGQGASFELFLVHGTDHFDPEVIERRRVSSDQHPGRRTEDSQAPPQLPMATTTSEPLDSPPVSETFPLARGRRPRILVVEDEKDLRDFIVEILSQHFEVLTATDGRHGMDRIRSERPDLVITDMMMPVMSGTELCRAVKQDPSLRVTPVILLTARSGAESTLDGYSSGADDFISKPFHTRVLLARVRAQLKLRALALQLADQSRLTSASALAAGIAHEVKNPLNAVLNATRGLPKVGVDTTTGAKLMRTIEEGALRIGDIVSVLEDHVRPADGAERSVCDINTGIESTLRLLEFKLKGLSVHDDPATRHQVVASGRELNQVILNLLDNAAMAEPHNVWVDVSRVGPDVVVDISDDGAGVPSEFAKVIFEPFFTTRGSGKGTGLVLYLARRVVADYGGDLNYHPRSGGGSTFSLRLPAMDSDVSGAVGKVQVEEPVDPALNASR
jgi:signal transduction histidine kinase